MPAERLDRDQRRVMGAIEACRTAALGGGRLPLAARGAERGAVAASLSQMPGSGSGAWVAARQAGELLPVPYFHVVFTLPAPVGAMAFQNKAAVYAILRQAARATHARNAWASAVAEAAEFAP